MMSLNKQELLSQMKQGEHVSIASLFEGNTLNRRLTSLGFTPGVEIEIIQNFGHGPIIVQIRGSKIALGRGEAAKITVERR